MEETKEHTSDNYPQNYGSELPSEYAEEVQIRSEETPIADYASETVQNNDSSSQSSQIEISTGTFLRPVVEWIYPNEDHEQNIEEINEGSTRQILARIFPNDDNVQSSDESEIPFSTMVPMSDVIVMDDEDNRSNDEDNRSTYTGHIIEDGEYASGSFSGRKSLIWPSVPWLTYGRLLQIGLLVIMVSILGILFNPSKTIVVQLTYSPTFGPSGVSSYFPTAIATNPPSYSIHPSVVPSHAPTADVTNSPSSAQPFTPTLPIIWNQVSSDIVGFKSDELFGTAVAISNDGNRICVGGTGTIRIFDLTKTRTWSMVKDLSSYFTEERPQISRIISGISISISSNGLVLIYGHRTYDNYRGSVSIFHDDVGEWIQLGNNLYGEEIDSFGYSVDITGDGGKVVVGTYYKDYVYVFQWLNKEWVLEMKVVGDSSSGFGKSVSIASDGNRMIIGAHRGNSVYIYALPSYSLVQTINGKERYDDFGIQVSMSRDGSCLAAGTFSDYVRVFRVDPSGTTYSLIRDSIVGTTDSWFGASLSLSADCRRLAVGAIRDSNGGFSVGKTFLYAIEEDNWNSNGEITGETVYDEWGVSVALSGDGRRVAVGAWLNDNDVGLNSGHTRVYESMGGT